MIKANELRLGNFISTIDNKIICTSVKGFFGFPVNTGIVNHNNDINDFEYLKPIPLTEEWLIKFGFSLMTDTTPYNYRIHKNKSFCYIRYGEFGTFEYGFEKLFKGFNGLFIANKFVRVIKYVHDLQNLYFALTGEELTINENE